MSGTVDRIFIASREGGAMKRVMEVEAVVGVGLSGDCYAERTGYYSGVDECEIILIEGETIDAIDAETDLAVLDDEHGRNIVTRGVRLFDLIGSGSRSATPCSSTTGPAVTVSTSTCQRSGG